MKTIEFIQKGSQAGTHLDVFYRQSCVFSLKGGDWIATQMKSGQFGVTLCHHSAGQSNCRICARLYAPRTLEFALMRLKEIAGVMSLLAALMFVAEPALAAGFSGAQAKADFLHGLWHPLGGLDHILAMIGVGIWAALVLTRKRLVWPLVFTLVMFMAFWARFIGVVVPYIEPGILASVIVIGLLVAFALRLPVVVGALIVGVFAVFHGAAHANEANASSLLIYAAGFSVSTFALSLAGLGLGSLTEWSSGRMILRALGAASALFGIYMFYMTY